MNTADVTVRQHRLLALLLPALEAAGIVLSLDRYIRLQRLWACLPVDCSPAQFKMFSCPIFATDERQQDLFYHLFDQILEKDLEWPKAPETVESSEFLKSGESSSNEKTQSEKTADFSTHAPAVRPGRRPLVVELKNCTEPPFSWNIAPKDDSLEINIGEGFGKTMLQLRRREWSDATELDIEATVQAIITAGGLPEFRYRQRTQPPEYLLLVERFSRNDHRAGLFDHVFQTFRSNEVFVERFFYDSDLRINRNEQYPNGLNLYELRHRYPDAQLIVLGSGYRLLSSNTGKLAEWAAPLHGWRMRALLTPIPRAEWGYQEDLLDKVFLLLPASIESLQYLAEPPAAEDTSYELLPDYLREVAEMEPIQLQEDIMPILRQHFDSGMLCWLAACAVYPSLHFDLTLRLGKVIGASLGYELLTAQNILDLTRLPWFISGQIPLPAREKLWQYLEQRHPERRKKVLGYLRDLMEKNKPVNKNSVAWAEHRANLTIIKAMTSKKPAPEMVEELRAVITYLDGEEGWGDFVLLSKEWEKRLEQYANDTQASVEEPNFKVSSKASLRKKVTRKSGRSVVTPKPLNIFISYSHRDQDQLLNLTKALQPLIEQKRIAIWDDSNILAGESFDESIRQNLATADIFLLLVSTDFLASEYINEVELATMFERHTRKECVILPILLNHCSWEKIYGIGNLSILPKEKKTRTLLPVSSWPNQDTAFAAIAKEIEKLVLDIENGTIVLYPKQTDKLFNEIEKSTKRSKAKQKKWKVFLCYARENQPLMDDFCDRFKDCNERDMEILYDRNAASGNMHEIFHRFATECDVAVLLVNARLVNPGSYANQYEVPVLLERQRAGEVILVGVRFSNVSDLEEWNAEGNIYFFSVINNDLPYTRDKNRNDLAYLRKFAVYEQIDENDREGFHDRLRVWIKECIRKISRKKVEEYAVIFSEASDYLKKISRAKISVKDEDFITNLSDTLDHILDKYGILLEDSPKANSLKKSLDTLAWQLANIVLSINSGGHKDPENDISGKLEAFKSAFEGFVQASNRLYKK